MNNFRSDRSVNQKISGCTPVGVLSNSIQLFRLLCAEYNIYEANLNGVNLVDFLLRQILVTLKLIETTLGDIRSVITDTINN